MRFLYALAVLAVFSTSAMAQAPEDQVDPELVINGSPDITVNLNNTLGPADLPGAYFPQDTSLTLYVGASLFQTTTGTPLGVVYTFPGVTGQAVVGLRADGSEAIGCTGALQTDPTDIVNDIAGKIVLIKRGVCSFAYKAENAQDAGAIGVVVYNGSDRVGPADVIGNMSAPDDAEVVTVPVVLVPNGIGQPIVDEVVGGGTVTLTIRARQVVAAEPTVGTTNSGLEVRGANPFTFSTDLRVFTEATEAVRVEVYNVRGQLVSTLFDGAVAGERSVAMTSSDLAAGVYFVRATGETFTSQQQVTVVR
jgi:hypothetical protein